MTDKLETLSRQVSEGRNFDSPPLHLWQPALSGDIDIHITADGTWYHQGDSIKRESLRNLFASILRREEDGCYYLVTPAEKWRITVASHALLVVDVERQDNRLMLTLNTGQTVVVDEQHPLFLDASLDNVAAVRVWHGLSALFNRAAWYRLVELADNDNTVTSGDFTLRLSDT